MNTIISGSKLYILDVSINSSESIIRDFYEEINDDFSNTHIAVFDNRFCLYEDLNELFDDFKSRSEDFFCNHAAYYDCVMGILSRARKSGIEEVIILSPEIDDCSILADIDMYQNYINHYILNHGNITFSDYDFYSSSSTTYDNSIYSFFRRLFII